MERLDADMNRLLAFLFREGVLDDHFTQLHQLQDEATPNFVSEVISIYFRESEKHLRTLRFMMYGDGAGGSSSSEGEADEGEGEEEEEEATDDHYERMGLYLNQFIGSSSSVGAKRVRNVCVAFRTAAEDHSRSGSFVIEKCDHCVLISCIRLLEVLEYEYCYLKNMLYEYLQLEQQRMLMAGVRYPLLP